MKSRKTVEFSESFKKRWLGYVAAAGAAGVGMLGSAQPAQADIIYTPANIYANPGNFPFGLNIPIDVNHDTIDDFQFRLYGFYQGARSSSGHVNFGPLGVVGNGFEVGPLSKGAVIGPGGKFITSRYSYGLAWGFRSNYGQYGGINGPWVDAVDKFLGLEVNVNGETHFGWAELSISVGGQGFMPILDVEGYAYDTVAGQSILAGQTSTPEPGTLGLLALGSLGLGLWRRRKAATTDK